MDNEKIIPKFDYYTAVFRNHTLDEVLTYFKLENVFDDFMKNMFTRSQGYMTSVILAYNNIQFSFDYAEYLTYKPSLDGVEPDLFNFNFKWIRADFSGQALDFMRKTFGYEFVDSFIMARPDEKIRFDVTRVDIAYDFINYQPEFVQKMVDHMMYCQQKGLARVPLMAQEGGNKYSVKFGNQLTIYIGATSSDRLLRVYDKKKQFCPDGVWKEQCPYMENEDCQSWFRIELQLRRDRAKSILYGDVTEIRNSYVDDFFLNVLRYIYDSYSFRDIDIPIHRPVIAEFWLNLWNWDNIPSIIQNFDYRSLKIRTTKETVEFNLRRNIKNIALFYALHGQQGIVDEIDDYFKYLNSICSSDSEEFKRYRHCKAFLSLLNELEQHNVIITNKGIERIKKEK